MNVLPSTCSKRAYVSMAKQIDKEARITYVLSTAVIIMSFIRKRRLLGRPTTCYLSVYSQMQAASGWAFI